MQTLCRVCFFFFYAGWGFGVIVVNEMIELSISHWVLVHGMGAWQWQKYVCVCVYIYIYIYYIDACWCFNLVAWSLHCIIMHIAFWCFSEGLTDKQVSVLRDWHVMLACMLQAASSTASYLYMVWVWWWHKMKSVTASQVAILLYTSTSRVAIVALFVVFLVLALN